MMTFKVSIQCSQILIHLVLSKTQITKSEAIIHLLKAARIQLTAIRERKSRILRRKREIQTAINHEDGRRSKCKNLGWPKTLLVTRFDVVYWFIYSYLINFFESKRHIVHVLIKKWCYMYRAIFTDPIFGLNRGLTPFFKTARKYDRNHQTKDSLKPQFSVRN